MKKSFTLITALLIFSFSTIAQQANIQIVHNSPDTAASQVDVYLGANQLFDDFQFKTATPFNSVPTNNPAIIAIAPANSNDSSDAIYRDTFNLMDGQQYRLVASGVLNPNQYANNPNGKNIGFKLQLNNPAIDSAESDSVSIEVFHGVPDFGEATLKIRNNKTLANNANFNQFSPTTKIKAGDGPLNLLDANGNLIATFETPGFDTLGGEGGLLMTSGFAAPSNNNMGEGLSISYVLSDGQVIELDTFNNAIVQLVHNAADPALERINIHEAGTGTLLIEDFSYHEATSFIPLDADKGIVIRDEESADTLASFNDLSLKPADTYSIVANGVADTSQFVKNPDGRDIAFNLFMNEDARTTGYNGNDQVDFNVFHGITDAPHIDVNERSSNQTLVNNLGYGNYTDYLSIPSGDYLLDVVDSSGDVIIHTSALDKMTLDPLLGSSALVFASGFNQPGSNQGEAGFELMAALPNGSVDTLASFNQADVQITHNAPDPDLDTVDVYVNERQVLDSFPFRASTPYLPLPANDTIEIGFAPMGSSGPEDILKSFKRRLTSIGNYHIMAVGVLEPDSYPDNPEDKSTELNLLTNIPSREVPAPLTGGDTALTSLIHGVPDAPTADVSFSPEIYPNLDLVQSLTYKESTDFLPIIAQEYEEILVKDNNSGNDLLSFNGDISAFADSTLVTYVSGFVNSNETLPEVQLLSVTPNGTTYTWERNIIGFNEQSPDGNFDMGVYPNPATDEARVSFTLDKRKKVSLNILNNNGQRVKAVKMGAKGKGTHDKVIDVNNLQSGIYHLQLKLGEVVNNAKLLIR